MRKSAAIADPQAVFAWLLTTTRRAAWRTAAATRELRHVGDLPTADPGPETLAVDDAWSRE